MPTVGGSRAVYRQMAGVHVLLSQLVEQPACYPASPLYSPLLTWLLMWMAVQRRLELRPRMPLPPTCSPPSSPLPAGKYMLAHAASAQGIAAVETICDRPRVVNHLAGAPPRPAPLLCAAPCHTDDILQRTG